MTQKAHPRLRELKFTLVKIIKNPSAILGFSIVFFFLVVAAFAPLLSPPPAKYAHNPYKIEKLSYKPVPLPPSEKAMFGTTKHGYDIYHGIVWGSRTMLKVVGVVITLSVLLGVFIGAVAGYFGGKIDDVLMRITDIFYTIPAIVLAMAIVVSFGRGIEKIMLALVLVRWRGYARVMRAGILALRELDYVQAARVIGVSDFKIIMRHIIPNSIYPVMILAFLDIGNVVIACAFFAFIGLGEGRGFSDWGQLLAEAQSTLIGPDGTPFLYWFTYVYPGLCIVLFTLGWNLIGDAMRDTFDPKVRRS